MTSADELAYDQNYAAADPLNLDGSVSDHAEAPDMFDVRVGRMVPMSEILKGIPEPDMSIIQDPRYALYRVGIRDGLDRETCDRFMAELDRDVDEHCALAAAGGYDDGID